MQSAQNAVCVPTKTPAILEQLSRLGALSDETIRLAMELETRFQSVIEQADCANSDKAECDPPIPNRVDLILRNSCDKLELAHSLIRSSFERALL